MPIQAELAEVIVWRAISSRRRFGHWEYMYEDYILCNHIGDYILEAQTLQAERITLHRIGPYKYVTNMIITPMRGVQSIKKIRSNSSLEDFSGVTIE